MLRPAHMKPIDWERVFSSLNALLVAAIAAIGKRTFNIDTTTIVCNCKKERKQLYQPNALYRKHWNFYFQVILVQLISGSHILINLTLKFKIMWYRKRIVRSKSEQMHQIICRFNQLSYKKHRRSRSKKNSIYKKKK